MATHSFDIDVAIKYGAEASTILTNIEFWIEKNRANNKHFYEGRYWTYNSVKAFNELFPYMTPSQIRKRIDLLRSDGLLIKGSFNKKPFDQTSWYSIDFNKLKGIRLKSNLHLRSETNGDVPEDKPIPDSKLTDINNHNRTNSKTRVEETRPPSFEDKCNFFIELFNETKGTKEKPSRFKLNKKVRASLKEALGNGYTSKDIKKAIENCKKDEYHINTNLKYLTPEFILRPDKLERFLNVEEEKKVHHGELSNSMKRRLERNKIA